MYVPSLLWLAGGVTTAIRALRTRLQIVHRQLRQTLARRHRVHTRTRTPHDPRPPSTYTMLVESDVQRGMHGILP
jgi:hypothetical protein